MKKAKRQRTDAFELRIVLSVRVMGSLLGHGLLVQ